ncbi:MAG: FlgD immunoglobulin-like domain containing protein, partial [Kiritimatiellia bacterium]|nr:FlgD immunoglobulin-like domain containing protein [Kiritimatiellia bacterium]
ADLKRDALIPDETAVLANFPNPFNPETWIPYQLHEGAKVTMTIFDALGRIVRRLDLGYQSAGYYRARHRAAYWDGRNNDSEPVSSGAYFIELTAGNYRKMRRIVLLK